MCEGERFLSRAEVAERIGVRPGSMSRYELPEPDAVIGSVRGWRESTIDEWKATRPGHGWRAGLMGWQGSPAGR